MNAQLTLDDWTPAVEAQHRDDAINAHAPNERAMEAIKRNLRQLPALHEVTSCTLLPDLSSFGFNDPRAVGSLMRKASKAGWIQPTDKHRPSQRPGNHCRPTRVYLNTLNQ